MLILCKSVSSSLLFSHDHIRVSSLQAAEIKLAAVGKKECFGRISRFLRISMKLDNWAWGQTLL